MNPPTIGRVVIYRTDGRNGLVYDLPAIVNCTKATHPGDYPGGEHNPLPVPDSDEHVHLTVFTPGGFGTRTYGPAPATSEEFVGAVNLIPGSGTYVELNVPMDDGEGDPVHRSWRWPEIH